MASAIDTVAPHLPAHVRVLPASVARRPGDLARALMSSARVVHLNPSLRRRSVLRDGLLHRTLRARGARTLVHWHGVDRALLKEIGASPLRRRWLRRAFGDANRVFVVDPDLYDAWTRWGLGPAELVGNPAATSGLPRAPDPHRLLFVGRLTETKGIADLGVALGLLRRRTADATLVLAGAGPCRLVGPGIRTLGWIDGDRRATELAKASAFVLPTRDDAAPLAVLEALAAGVPVVATRTGAIPRIVGDFGELVDRPDPASVAAAVERVWARRLGPPPDLRCQRPEAIARHWVGTYQAIACG